MWIMVNKKILFIGGMPRSGTSIIADIIAEHTETINVGETVHLWQRGLINNELCACNKLFSKCEFWSEVGNEMFGGWEKSNPQQILAFQKKTDRTRYLPKALIQHHFSRQSDYHRE